ADAAARAQLLHAGGEARPVGQECDGVSGVHADPARAGGCGDAVPAARGAGELERLCEPRAAGHAAAATAADFALVRRGRGFVVIPREQGDRGTYGAILVACFGLSHIGSLVAALLGMTTLPP